MTNNDILGRIRYIFDFNDSKVISIFSLADLNVTREQMSDWLQKEEHPNFKSLNDELLITFLNGLINDKRGKKEGVQPSPEKKLSNNIIFRKLKIALDLKAEDVLVILQLADFSMSNHELSSLFRKKGHKHYRECQEQVLCYFLQGLQIKYRDNK